MLNSFKTKPYTCTWFKLGNMVINYLARYVYTKTRLDYIECGCLFSSKIADAGLIMSYL